MSPTRLRPASVELRRHVTETSLRLFSHHGYEAVSIEMICGSAGISVGSLYHHFDSKAGVAAAIYAEAIRRYHEPLLAVVAREPNARDGIRALVEAHHAWVAADSDWAHFMLAYGGLAEIRAEAAAHREANLQLTTALTEWANPLVDAGQLVPLDAPAFLAAVFGPSYFHTRVALSQSAEPPDPTTGAVLADLAWRGLRGPAAST